MITYDKYPISAAEASRLRAWLTGSEAHLFKECVSAEMNSHYLDAVNHQSKPTESVEDECKFNNLAESSLAQASEVSTFIRIFEQFSGPDSGFFKLKVNT